jgi:hypothetical protein
MEIYDPLRKKYVRRTPEEEVRQGIIRWLNSECDVPMTMMASEYSFVYNSRKYRADVVVFDRSLAPAMMVECKAPSVTLDQVVIDQVTRYARVLKVRYILISNGTVSHICERNGDGNYTFISGMPDYNKIIGI